MHYKIPFLTFRTGILNLRKCPQCIKTISFTTTFLPVLTFIFQLKFAIDPNLGFILNLSLGYCRLSILHLHFNFLGKTIRKSVKNFDSGTNTNFDICSFAIKNPQDSFGLHIKQLRWAAYHWLSYGCKVTSSSFLSPGG